MSSRAKLLDRETFQARVFKRDSYRCVVPDCHETAVDAHHIIERRLWASQEEIGGYFRENGASVCSHHHRLAEANHIPPAAFWLWTSETPRLPSGWEPGIYNKWGDRIPDPADKNPEHSRYPHTPYMNISPGLAEGDDMVDISTLLEVPSILTIKMDGANTAITRDQVVARNGSHAKGPAFDALKSWHAGMRWFLPEGYTFYGEWLWNTHSIRYEGSLALDSYFQVFSVFHEASRMFLSWPEVEKMCDASSLIMVPTVLEFTGREPSWKIMTQVASVANEMIAHGHEGVVLRSLLPFHWGDFRKYVAKYVRPGHTNPLRNQLKSESH